MACGVVLSWCGFTWVCRASTALCHQLQADQWEMAAFCERQARERTEVALDALQAQVDTRSVAYTEMQLRCERAEARVGADDAELCAHARGFLAYDEDVPLKAANDEPTAPEQLGWFTGWLERAWQVKAERAENELNQAWAVLVKVRKALGSLWPALKSVQDDIWAFSEAASEADRKARKETDQ